MLCLVFGSPMAAQEGWEPYVRFFNDSSKTVYFYVDGKFGCSIPANPEGNLAYCDAEISKGKHTVSIRGSELRRQSCDLLIDVGGAEANLSKGGISVVGHRVPTHVGELPVEPMMSVIEDFSTTHLQLLKSGLPKTFNQK